MHKVTYKMDGVVWYTYCNAVVCVDGIIYTDGVKLTAGPLDSIRIEPAEDVRR